MKKNQIYLTLGIIVVVLLVISVIFSDKERDYESVKLGMVVPLSGAGAVYGDGYIKGANLAIESLFPDKEKGIEIFVQDSKFDGKASVDAANHLLNINKVDVLVSLFHLPASAINSLAKESKVPHIYEAMTTSMVEESPYTFKSNFDALTGCEELLNFAKNNNEYNKIGVLMARTEYNELCLEGMRKVESEIKEYWYNFGDTDFKTLLTKANNQEVDTLMTMMVDFEYLAMFKQLTELGYDIKVICATASECINPVIQEEIPLETLNNTLATDILPPNVRETNFGKKYLEKYPEASFAELNYAIAGYEMINYIKEASRNCGSDKSACIHEELQRVSEYSSVLNSRGFDDRILQIDNKIYRYEAGEWALQE